MLILFLQTIMRRRRKAYNILRRRAVEESNFCSAKQRFLFRFGIFVHCHASRQQEHSYKQCWNQKHSGESTIPKQILNGFSTLTPSVGVFEGGGRYRLHELAHVLLSNGTCFSLLLLSRMCTKVCTTCTEWCTCMLFIHAPVQNGGCLTACSRSRPSFPSLLI